MYQAFAEPIALGHLLVLGTNELKPKMEMLWIFFFQTWNGSALA